MGILVWNEWISSIIVYLGRAFTAMALVNSFSGNLSCWMEHTDVSVKRYFRKELLHVNCFATLIFESQNIDYFLGFCHSGPLHYLYFLQCHYLYFFLLVFSWARKSLNHFGLWRKSHGECVISVSRMDQVKFVEDYGLAKQTITLQFF